MEETVSKAVAGAIIAFTLGAAALVAVTRYELTSESTLDPGDQRERLQEIRERALKQQRERDAAQDRQRKSQDRARARLQELEREDSPTPRFTFYTDTVKRHWDYVTVRVREYRVESGLSRTYKLAVWGCDSDGWYDRYWETFPKGAKVEDLAQPTLRDWKFQSSNRHSIAVGMWSPRSDAPESKRAAYACTL